MQGILMTTGILALLGILAGILLTAVSEVLTVPENETKQAARDALPGANCGACGYTGCDGYAEALSEGLQAINLCTPGGDATARALSELLDIPFESVEQKIATVRCRGHLHTTEYIMDYIGPKTCYACTRFYNGRRRCSYACLAFGDCERACPYDAIHVTEEKVAYVDPEKCTGCGMCAEACPAGLIKIHSADARVFVTCSSHDKGGFTRKLCENGCIGCGKCLRVCPHDAIVLNENLAYVDEEKCQNCGACIGVCPTHAIHAV